VHPKFQRQGFGCAILLGLLTCAIAHGSNYATLEVRASNQVAIALYETFGFKTAGRRPHYYSDPRSNTSEDALILWRSGLQTAEFKTQTMQRWQSLERRWANQHWKIASPFEEILR
jgi:[ribosomal protein S18]-alanine N-acetyltransferase